MAAFGYLVFLVRASVPYRSRALYRLGTCGTQEADLLDTFNEQLLNLGTGYHSDPDNAEGFRVRDVEKFQRATALRINKGPAGGTGETYDFENDVSVETGEKHALLSGLRAKLYVPSESHYGLLFVERIGGRQLKSLVYERLLRPAAISVNAMVRVESFAQYADWQRELSDQQVLRVSELLTAADGSSDSSTVNDTRVRIVTTGTAVRRVSDRIKDVVLTRVRQRDQALGLTGRISPLEQKRRIIDAKKSEASNKPVYKSAPKSSFTVQDEEQYQALKKQLDALEKNQNYDEELRRELSEGSRADRQGLKTESFDVSLGTERPEKTFVVEGDTMPQFVYETQTRLSEGQLKDLWDAHAEKILGDLDAELDDKWLLAVEKPKISTDTRRS